MDVGPFYFLTRHLMFLAAGHGAGVLADAHRAEDRRSSAASCCCCCASPAAAGVRAGHRPQRQRRAALDQPGHLQLPGGRGGQADATSSGWRATSCATATRSAPRWPAMLKPLRRGRRAGRCCCCCSRTSVRPSLLLAITGGMLVLGGVQHAAHVRRRCWSACRCWRWWRSLEPYRVRRLTSFMDPWADPFDSGYQLTNALMAIGRGEWLGVGLGGIGPEARTTCPRRTPTSSSR